MITLKLKSLLLFALFTGSFAINAKFIPSWTDIKNSYAKTKKFVLEHPKSAAIACLLLTTACIGGVMYKDRLGYAWDLHLLKKKQNQINKQFTKKILENFGCNTIDDLIKQDPTFLKAQNYYKSATREEREKIHPNNLSDLQNLQKEIDRCWSLIKGKMDGTSPKEDLEILQNEIAEYELLKIYLVKAEFILTMDYI
jgi:hypothetical protein